MGESGHLGPLAIIGHPVAHSLSPRIHNTALGELGLPPVYEARDISPDRLEAGVLDLVEAGFEGFNVTLPHKQAIVPLLDRLDVSARRVGAVNTVCIDRSAGAPVRIGYNTDVEGFLMPLDGMDDRLNGGRMLVWGAGGASRAVIAGLLDRFRPETITVVSRRSDPAFELAAALDDDGAGCIVHAPWPVSAHAVEAHDLLVNATPLGMHPDVDGTPAPDGIGFRPGQIVYDLIYHPAETRLLTDARRSGAETIGGLPMLVGQAAAAFRLWTGRDMPLQAVLDELGPTGKPS